MKHTFSLITLGKIKQVYNPVVGKIEYSNWYTLCKHTMVQYFGGKWVIYIYI